jgi:hypothetical protein
MWSADTGDILTSHRFAMEELSMTDKRRSNGKESASKQQANLKDLPQPSQELSEGQAKAVKGGASPQFVKTDKDKIEPYLQ